MLFIASVLFQAVLLAAPPPEGRGFGDGKGQQAEDLHLLGNIPWWYDWGLNPHNATAKTKTAAEFVAMAWGKKHKGIPLKKYLESWTPESSTRHLLGFNEPNLRKQSNLTAKEACALWPLVLSSAKMHNLSVGSPAANHCQPNENCFLAPEDWFDSFFALPGCGLDTVDFIATHKYGCNATSTVEYVKFLHQRYGKPIWLTEFSCAEAPVAKQLAFMSEILPIFDSMPQVIPRYAWFAARTDRADRLIEKDALTALGRLYTQNTANTHPQKATHDPKMGNPPPDPKMGNPPPDFAGHEWIPESENSQRENIIPDISEPSDDLDPKMGNIPHLPGYHLVPELSDEFDGDTLDPSKWSTSLSVLHWRGRQPGLFDPGNVVVRGGYLQLWARAARRNASWPTGFDNYTTAAVHSVHNIHHGYSEIRWRSGSSGISSSWWLHDNNGTSWTEIDVFETTGVDNPSGAHARAAMLPSHVHVFKLPRTNLSHLPVQCGCKCGHPGKAPCSKGSYYTLPNGTFAESFHTAGLNWTDTGVTILLDGVIVGKIPSPCLQQPLGMDFDRETMPGWMALPDPASLPDRPFEVDYVRTWKKNA